MGQKYDARVGGGAGGKLGDVDLMLDLSGVMLGLTFMVRLNLHRRVLLFICLGNKHVRKKNM